MDADEDIIVRMGAFFLLIGFVLFVIFIASDFGKAPKFDFLCLAMLAISVGLLFRSRKPPRASAGRFGMIHKARENAKKRKEEKQKAKEKK